MEKSFTVHRHLIRSNKMWLIILIFLGVGLIPKCENWAFYGIGLAILYVGMLLDDIKNILKG